MYGVYYGGIPEKGSEDINWTTLYLITPEMLASKTVVLAGASSLLAITLRSGILYLSRLTAHRTRSYSTYMLIQDPPNQSISSTAIPLLVTYSS